eukprot:GDKI01011250.1.p1 GENE.GDKI01011250.1~~GDKI01011250.1.p1  ORF type:complete len:236 (-),score=60.13 GDKI01011250.1:363-1070(-)
MAWQVEFQKVEAICDVNKDIIQRIERKISSDGQVISEYKYTLEFDQNTKEFSVKTEPVKRNAGVIVKETPFSPEEYTLAVVDDTFNDNIDNTSSRGFEAIAVLNSKMLTVAQKYKLFEGTPTSLAVLEKFLQNFGAVQSYLGCIEAKLIDTTPLSLDDVASLNTAYSKLLNTVPALVNSTITIQQPGEKPTASVLSGQVVTQHNYVELATVKDSPSWKWTKIGRVQVFSLNRDSR